MFLIDANDVQGPARNRLIDGLRRLARAYGTPSIVVFEGSAHVDLPHRVYQGVKVVYAGGQGRAHDHILHLVDLDGESRSYTVVSPDGALVRRVSSRGARTAPPVLLRRALDHVEQNVA